MKLTHLTCVFLQNSNCRYRERRAPVGCVAAIAPAFNHFVGKSDIVRTVDFSNFAFCMKKQSRKFAVRDTKVTSQYEFSVKIETI